MSEENINERRDELLADFRQSIHQPMSERYYDEDDLIEIFDFAGDVNDDYIRLEVLMCAARFHPDSEQLLQRKVIFYSQFSDDSRLKCLDDNNLEQGMIWDIMRAKSHVGDSEENRIKVFSDIVDKYNNYTDEEIIQLIELSTNLGVFSWIKNNMPVLRKKVGYINIFLYETAVAADIQGETAFSIELLDELTRLEPFSSYYWLMLARQYAIVGDYEKGMQAIDYSLALYPDDAQALFVKARLLYETETPDGKADLKIIDEIISIMEKACSSDQVMPEMSRFLAGVYNEKGKPAKAAEALNRHIERFPQDIPSIVPDLLLFRPANSIQLIEDFYSANEENSEIIWVSWAQQLSVNGYPDIAKLLIESYQRLSGKKVDTVFQIEDLFLAKRFVETISAIEDFISNNDLAESQAPALALMHILSLIKTGKIVHATILCEKHRELAQTMKVGTISAFMEKTGFLKLLEVVSSDLVERHDTQFWVDYDPFGFWR